MRYSVAGLNFKTAPAEIRGLYSILPHNTKEVYSKTAKILDGEFLWLSTCNRTELYFAGKGGISDREILKVFYSVFGYVAPAEYFYVYHDRFAVKHLFEVVTGVDSLVVGEKEIVGQIKEAFRRGREFGGVGKYLDKLFSTALHVNKDVRSKIEGLSSPLSIPYVAIKVVREKIGALSDAPVLIVGTGAMAELVAKSLVEYGAGDLYFTSRHLDRARSIAGRWNGSHLSREEALKEIERFGVVVLATNLSEPIITEELYRNKKGIRQIIVDISIPHGAEFRERVEGVEVLYLDDLKEVVEENKKERERAIRLVDEVIERESVRFMGWLVEQYVAPMIERMFTKSEEIRESMMAEFYQKNDVPPHLVEKIDQQTSHLVRRLIHIHMEKIRQATRGIWDDEIYNLIYSIFTRYEANVKAKSGDKRESVSPGSDKKG